MQLAPQAYSRLKAETRRVVKSAGGLESAELDTRIGRCGLSTAQSNNHPQYLPIDALVDLTITSENLSLICTILDLLGYQSPLPKLETTKEHFSTDLINSIAIAQKETSEAVTIGFEASLDGEFTDDELKSCFKEFGEAEEAARQVKLIVAKHLADRGIKVGQ